MAAKAKNIELAEAFIELLLVFLEPSQKSKMELFAKIINAIKPLTIFTKRFSLRCLTGF